MAEWARVGMPVTNKNAYRAARRQEIKSGQRTSLTPNQAKKAFTNATKKTAAEAALGAGLGVAAPIAVLAASGGGGVHTAARAASRATNSALKKTGIEAAKKQYVRKLLNRAARGNHTLTKNMINKAIQRSGGDPRVAHALEKGGQVARNLLRVL